MPETLSDVLEGAGIDVNPESADILRFDLAEALNVLALDYGLYAVNARLTDLGFCAGVRRDTYRALEDDGRAIYAALEPMAAATVDPYAVPTWAAEVLARIGSEDES